MIEAQEYDSMKSLSLLESLKDRYAFHGSPNDTITVLSPRQANDTRGDPFNSDNAVYATVNPWESIIYSVVDISSMPKEITNNTTWSVSYERDTVAARMPKAWKPFVERTVGSVYALPMKSFSERNGPHVKSKTVVEPELRVLVMMDDFLKKGGKIVWKD